MSIHPHLDASSPLNHALPGRTRSNVLHLDTHKLLNELNVRPSFLGQIIERLSSRCGLFPSLQLLILDLHTA